MKRSDGFTLIEMMIVVAILVVLVAIAIPNLLRAKLEANETGAIGDLRVIGTAQITYHASNSTFGSFDDLRAGIPAFIEAGWADGRERNGYRYSMPSADTQNFICYADPITPGESGNRFFRIDVSGIVRYREGSQPDENDPAVGQ